MNNTYSCKLRRYRSPHRCRNLRRCRSHRRSRNHHHCHLTVTARSYISIETVLSVPGSAKKRALTRCVVVTVFVIIAIFVIVAGIAPNAIVTTATVAPGTVACMKGRRSCGDWQGRWLSQMHTWTHGTMNKRTHLRHNLAHHIQIHHSRLHRTLSHHSQPHHNSGRMSHHNQ